MSTAEPQVILNKKPTLHIPDQTWIILTLLALLGAWLENLLVPGQQLVNPIPYRVLLTGCLLLLIGLHIVAFYKPQLREKLVYNAQFYFALSILLIVWDLLTSKSNILPLPYFPGLAQILQVMVEDVGTLLMSTAYSMRLLVLGFIIGTALGIGTGVLIGWYQKWSYWLFPGIKIMGIIPATAWLPIAMILFPSSLYAGIFLIVICVWFPVAFMTSVGIANIQNSYFEAARTLGASERFLIFRVAIPGAMPSIFTGIYTAMSLSFTTLVVSEMIGAKAGLGWYINWAKGWSNYAKVYASIIIMAIVFSVVMELMFRFRDRVLIWQKGLVK